MIWELKEIFRKLMRKPQSKDKEELQRSFFKSCLILSRRGKVEILQPSPTLLHNNLMDQNKIIYLIVIDRRSRRASSVFNKWMV